MAKYALRLKARELRKQGVSVNIIAKQLGVSKGSASLWVRDIILSVEQLEKLRNSELKGAELGRLRSALLQKQRRLNLLKTFQEEGAREIGSLSKRELLLTGLALYWSEGSKKSGSFELCNSDPKMIKFFLYWLNKCFSIPLEQVKCRVGINEVHKERDDIVRNYWSEITGVPLSRFTKTSFKKVLNKKIYDNFQTHYGTLSVKVSRPGNVYYQVIGLIDGLSANLAG